MNRTNGSNPPPPPGMVKPPPPPSPPNPLGSAQTLSDQLQRIEDKLDTLIAALADGEDGPGVDLDGQPIPQPRDETETL